MKNILGSKGANLAEMCNIGIPVPPGFTISTVAYKSYYQDHTLSPNLCNNIKAYMAMLENEIGCKFGDSNNPLLVAIRSGSVDSMPGMLDTVLNVGLNDQTVIGLAKKVGERFAYDSYCRFMHMYAEVVLHISPNLFQDIINKEQHKNRVQNIAGLDVDTLKKIIYDFKNIVYDHTGQHFEQSVEAQLLNTINAVFTSWKNDRAVTYRSIHHISEELGTAVNIQAMVFGNLNNDSATGVIFTRHPSTGEKKHFGEFLINAQGEDIVSGTYTPLPINGKQKTTMEKLMSNSYKALSLMCHKLEEHYKDMQDIEFTIQNGKLWILQTRSGKRTAEAAIRIIVDMVHEEIITKEEGILRIDPKIFDQLLHPVLDLKSEHNVIGNGLPAAPGVASGYVVFNSNDAEEASKQGKKTILVRPETSPEDINGIHVASGIITARGGMTSHAAIVTRGMGKPCICSVKGLYIDPSETFFLLGKIKISKNDPITINGSTGSVMLGILPTISPTLSKEFKTILSWIDTIKTIKVRANADTPLEAKVAKEFGAEGIGLCRTEHMFFAHNRIEFMQKLILADDENERANALRKLGEMQLADFKKIFSIMENKVVTIRLLDPPLHEFLPTNQTSIAKIAQSLNKPIELVQNKIMHLTEKNPMLGHRGCRLAVAYPEIYAMQINSIFCAAQALQPAKVKLEIMIPFIISEKELIFIDTIVKKEAQKFSIDYSIGTMIELPRAALIADKLAKHAAFFSFGTNDLTQTTMGLSRDDSVSFLDSYKQNDLFEHDPFEELDREGVGELIKIAIERGKKTHPGIELGLCGEHGANPTSIAFSIQSGIDYVSCAPYKIPFAKLVAAQYAIKAKMAHA